VTGALVVVGALAFAALRGWSRRAPAKPAASAVEPVRSPVVEDALWLMSIGDYEGGHLKLMGLPDRLAAADDPDCKVIEDSWATWKLEQIGEAKEPAKKREMLREIVATPAVSAKHRKKALALIRDLEADAGR
jgi:hypothetical protein